MRVGRVWLNGLAFCVLAMSCSSAGASQGDALEEIIEQMELGGTIEVLEVTPDEKGASAFVVVNAEEPAVRAGLRPPPGSERIELDPVSSSLGDFTVSDPTDSDRSCSVNLYVAGAEDRRAERIGQGSTGVVIISYCE